jgi:hypothetical protein
MKTLFGFLAAVVLLASAGCAGKAKQREAEAFRRGQQNALEAQSARDPSVWVRGMVRHPRVPWHENLTLSQALVAADYTGALNPWQIKVIRQGQVYRVDPKRLLRGQEDPVLEPEDIIEIPR